MKVIRRNGDVSLAGELNRSNFHQQLGRISGDRGEGSARAGKGEEVVALSESSLSLLPSPLGPILRRFRSVKERARNESSCSRDYRVSPS